jgi:hypothetical protein
MSKTKNTPTLRDYSLPFQRDEDGKLLWAITQDHLDDLKSTKEEKTAIKAEGCIYHFKIYDDDAILYYSGYSNDDSSFDPLDDYAMGAAGAVTIKYRNEQGRYEIL